MIRSLASLPRLHTIMFREEREVLFDDPLQDDDVEARLQPLIQAAANALKKHVGDENGKKWVRVWHRTGYGVSGNEDKLWKKEVEIGA
jgi:hypothetical protein